MAIQPAAVIFDYGNVLCGPQHPGEMQAMAEILAVPDEIFHPTYWRYRMPYDETIMDAQAYWQQVASDCKRSVTPEQVLQLSAIDGESWSHPNPVMVEWARELRRAGMRTAVLSNMPLEVRVYLTDVARWLPEFDHLTFSCDVKMVKPNADIYEHSLKGVGVPASEALFLDDRPENIAAAQKLGIHTIEFTTPEAAMAEIAGKYLLPVPIAV